MAHKLSELRLQLIDRVSDGLLKDVIDGLRASNPPVLTSRESNHILQTYPVLEDRIGNLVDTVCKKGDVASTEFISILEVKDRNLAEDLKLIGNERQTSGQHRMELSGANFR